LSKDAGKVEQEVSVDEILLRASQLREYLSVLQDQVNSVSAQISELQIVLDTLDSIPQTDSQVLVTLDRLTTVLIPATIPSTWHNELLVNIGKNYYIKTTRDKAREIVDKRLATLRRMLGELTRRYQVALTEYTALQRVLASLYGQLAQTASK